MLGPHLPQPASPGTLCDKWFWYTRRVSSKQQDRFTAPPDRGRKTCASFPPAGVSSPDRKKGKEGKDQGYTGGRLRERTCARGYFKGKKDGEDGCAKKMDEKEAFEYFSKGFAKGQNAALPGMPQRRARIPGSAVARICAVRPVAY